MKTNAYKAVAAALLAVSFAAGIGAAHASKTADGRTSSPLGNSAQQGDWVCPMHPEVHKHEPGKCPICKMNLDKQKPKGA